MAYFRADGRGKALAQTMKRLDPAKKSFLGGFRRKMRAAGLKASLKAEMRPKNALEFQQADHVS
jgi:hypothetical protein